MRFTALVLSSMLVAACAPRSKPTQPEDKANSPRPQTTAPVTPGSTNLPKLWDFFATWCPPCRQQAPIIAELEREYHGRIEIVSIDVEQNRELAKRFNVEAIPTLVFLDASGNELDRNVGLMQKADIVAKFRSLSFIQ
ncbi:MAG: thioredoxin family protein [candidate division WOR-3 bacterium]